MPAQGHPSGASIHVKARISRLPESFPLSPSSPCFLPPPHSLASLFSRLTLLYKQTASSSSLDPLTVLVAFRAPGESCSPTQRLEVQVLCLLANFFWGGGGEVSNITLLCFCALDILDKALVIKTEREKNASSLVFLDVQGDNGLGS